MPDWLAYIASAVAGILAVGILVYVIGKLVELFTRGRAGSATDSDEPEAAGYEVKSGSATSSTGSDSGPGGSEPSS